MSLLRALTRMKDGHNCFYFVRIGFLKLKVWVLDIGMLVVFHYAHLSSDNVVTCGLWEAATFQYKR